MTNAEFLSAVGMEIKVARIRAGLEIKDVAKLAGLHPSTVGNVERGEDGSLLLSIKRIADALGKQPKDFM